MSARILVTMSGLLLACQEIPGECELEQRALPPFYLKGPTQLEGAPCEVLSTSTREPDLLLECEGPDGPVDVNLPIVGEAQGYTRLIERRKVRVDMQRLNGPGNVRLVGLPAPIHQLVMRDLDGALLMLLLEGVALDRSIIGEALVDYAPLELRITSSGCQREVGECSVTQQLGLELQSPKGMVTAPPYGLLATPDFQFAARPAYLERSRDCFDRPDGDKVLISLIAIAR